MPVCNGDVERLPFRANSIEIVFMNSVLMFAPLAPTIREIARVLRPGGRLFFLEPTSGNPLVRLYRWWHGRYSETADWHDYDSIVETVRRSFAEVRFESYYLVVPLTFLPTPVRRMLHFDRYLARLFPCFSWLLLGEARKKG
jgi:ubiquinone/menaquinone biosynthesis C-methylase UbiE